MTVRHSLLDEPLIRVRGPGDALPAALSLPSLLAALVADEVRDFPALRPHQRHPWHAFLVQLAALALHRADCAEPRSTGGEWRDALLALTPGFPEGDAWCLVSPLDRPAFMQPAVSDGGGKGWKPLRSPDELDMLVTSKNHDLKMARMTRASPDDWLFALISLQTQEGFLGAGNYGISRMNGGFASRPGVGVVPGGGVGRRWARDVQLMLSTRPAAVDPEAGHGVGLVWLEPWDGLSKLSFSSLDPFYIEICRRVRLSTDVGGSISALTRGSKVGRIDASSLNGVTGDMWTPVDVAEAKALTITANGFDYKLASQLLFGSKYRPAPAQTLLASDGDTGVCFLAQGVTRGQGKTEGYHERRIPVSRRMTLMLREKHTDELARRAGARVDAIGKVRSMLWIALCSLFDNGAEGRSEKSTQAKASAFTRHFEDAEDLRFFEDLELEIEAADPELQHRSWLLEMAGRAEGCLRQAFEAGPRSAMRRHRAQAAALSRFHGALRNPKQLPVLANVLREQSEDRKSRTTQEEVES